MKEKDVKRLKEELPQDILVNGIGYGLYYCVLLNSETYHIMYVPYNKRALSYNSPEYNHTNLVTVMHDDLDFCIKYLKYELSRMVLSGYEEIKNINKYLDDLNYNNDLKLDVLTNDR